MTLKLTRHVAFIHYTLRVLNKWLRVGPLEERICPILHISRNTTILTFLHLSKYQLPPRLEISKILFTLISATRGIEAPSTSSTYLYSISIGPKLTREIYTS
jgi:hypothetical protein